jgi:hypothetical protein
MADDFNITPYGLGQFGTTFETETQVVVIHDGRRGVQGDEGDVGPQGEPGRSINIYGSWISGTTYCPGDAVTNRSRLVVGVTSMYIQRSASPCAISTIEPWQDPTRWTEVSVHDWTNSFGGIWEVTQLNHGFTLVGQPVGYSTLANRYILASAASEDELGIAIVREIIDAHRVILQSTGEIPDVHPDVVYPDGVGWTPGRVYYVSTARGRLELTPPVDANVFTNPILQITSDGSGPGLKNGVALPWRPIQGSKEYIPVGWTKFYFTGTAGQTLITGPDDNLQLLSYYPGPNTAVFVNGVNLFEDEFTATDGSDITLATPLAAGDKVEIWTPDRPLDVLVRSTTLKLDNIENQFNGTTIQFDLTYGGIPVVFQDASSVQIMLDATPQEPLIDYILIDNGGTFAIEFKDAPEAGTRFWGVALSPSGQAGVPPGGGTGDVLAKASPADGDMVWLSVISGGSW